MIDITKLLSANLEVIPFKKPIESVKRIATPELSRLYQRVGDRYIALNKGVVPGTADEYKMLGHAVEFFKQILRTRNPGSGVQAKAMNKYLQQMTEKIDGLKGTAPSLRRVTNIDKYMQHHTNEAASKIKPYITTKIPQTKSSVSAFFETSIKKYTSISDKLIQNASENILNKLEVSGITTPEIMKSILESKLPEAAKYERYLKRTV
jgi:hypothetical protein